MRFQSAGGSCVRIDLQATGILRAVAHNPTLRANPESLAIDYSVEAAEAAVIAVFRADAIEVPEDISASDREKMRDNLLSRDVLDVAGFPTVAFRGRYTGTLDGGALTGQLTVRGVAHSLAMPIRVSRETSVLLASGSWEGRLTDLGIKPFKALLGAIKLKDWIALRLAARLEPSE